MKNPHQNGNVLFLILIAVALFAALSFVISQSMRQNDAGGPTDEKNRVAGVYLHQFPTNIRQAIVRMRLSRGLTDAEISFAHLGSATYGTFGTSPAHEVFHPQGGGVPYQNVPADMNDGSDWIFNGALAVKNVGISDGTANSSELLALLPGISLETCKYINKGFSGAFTTPPSLTIAGENTPFAGAYTYSDMLSDPALDGQAAYCYYSTTLGKYVFYEVLVER